MKLQDMVNKAKRDRQLENAGENAGLSFEDKNGKLTEELERDLRDQDSESAGWSDGSEKMQNQVNTYKQMTPPKKQKGNVKNPYSPNGGGQKLKYDYE